MPSKKEYDLVSDDGYDSRIPLHNEDAFQHGIHFQAKYIGTLDVPRPSSRVEIVAAMRRIRYEFKAKAIKKKKVDLTISVEGVKVCNNKKKKKLPQWYDEKKLIIVHHPIYRIFYVSHDSQDLKIWSYIARDGPSNVFKCNVFKSYKKEQAMRIVRTIGQAFEVCHKLSIAPTVAPVIEDHIQIDTDSNQSGDTDRHSAKSKDFDEKLSSKRDGRETISPSKGRATPPTDLALRQAQQLLYQMAATSPQQIGGTTITSPINSPALIDDDIIDPQMPVSSNHQVQLLRQRMEHQQQQTQVAIAQVQLLKEQLAAETAARIESQARTHQLLLQNRDLMDHMNQILTRLQELEMRSNIAPDKQTGHKILQALSLPDSTTPQCGPVFLPRSLLQNADGHSLISPDFCMIENNKTVFDTDSPDSGHREMSSDSLALNLVQADSQYWETTHDDRLKYSFGFSSPVKFKQTSYEMTAVVNSNPFASGADHYSDQDVLDFSNYEEKLRVLAPVSQNQNEDSKLELKLEVAPKLRPPPEFRNCDAIRNPEMSDDDSSNSSNSDTDSAKDGIVNFTDSDYYSHTGNSSRTNMQNYQDNLDMKPAPVLVYKPRLEYHYNNFAEDSEGMVMRTYFDEDPRRKRHSFSDEENTESYDEGLVQPPSPPPPPSRLEEDTD